MGTTMMDKLAGLAGELTEADEQQHNAPRRGHRPVADKRKAAYPNGLAGAGGSADAAEGSESSEDAPRPPKRTCRTARKTVRPRPSESANPSAGNMRTAKNEAMRPASRPVQPQEPPAAPAAQLAAAAAPPAQPQPVEAPPVALIAHPAEFAAPAPPVAAAPPARVIPPPPRPGMQPHEIPPIVEAPPPPPRPEPRFRPERRELLRPQRCVWSLGPREPAVTVPPRVSPSADSPGDSDNDSANSTVAPLHCPAAVPAQPRGYAATLAAIMDWSAPAWPATRAAARGPAPGAASAGAGEARAPAPAPVGRRNRHTEMLRCGPTLPLAPRIPKRRIEVAAPRALQHDSSDESSDNEAALPAGPTASEKGKAPAMEEEYEDYANEAGPSALPEEAAQGEQEAPVFHHRMAPTPGGSSSTAAPEADKSDMAPAVEEPAQGERVLIYPNPHRRKRRGKTRSLKSMTRKLPEMTPVAQRAARRDFTGRAPPCALLPWQPPAAGLQPATPAGQPVRAELVSGKKPANAQSGGKRKQAQAPPVLEESDGGSVAAAWGQKDRCRIVGGSGDVSEGPSLGAAVAKGAGKEPSPKGRSRGRERGKCPAPPKPRQRCLRMQASGRGAVSFDTSSMPSGEEEQPGEGNDQVQPAPRRKWTAKEALELAMEQCPQLRAAVHAEQQRWAAQQALLQQAVREVTAQENNAPEYQAGAEPSQPVEVNSCVASKAQLNAQLMQLLAEETELGNEALAKAETARRSEQGLQHLRMREDCQKKIVADHKVAAQGVARAMKACDVTNQRVTDTQAKIAALQEELHGRITVAEAAHLNSVVASRREHAFLEDLAFFGGEIGHLLLQNGLPDLEVVANSIELQRGHVKAMREAAEEAARKLEALRDDKRRIIDAWHGSNPATRQLGMAAERNGAQGVEGPTAAMPPPGCVLNHLSKEKR
ncbi:hypothetical protein COCSUDRAFT_60509 [Coccomyxa subellipsoidea C-169]|uniref:Uncharacterized protein n=1 Tax=Coccomyxa subellipsoidea (strain C-169) TaxID=574566 RepID=I0YIB6_COCSC|nr:hypothetical protein COCSUDRAFT_60509 [Coccomyxa subellipsoidea C-169]EIE18135.1 hypothetical protein COCSUDRAFT_60509 [Coccomyxa subellipsoidea C-169]|eukprot:XP_005642679.1 hypothetical protein COCSUDRAFT_60509 [Coccomyxa subellipsoidea C-169]